MIIPSCLSRRTPNFRWKSSPLPGLADLWWPHYLAASRQTWGNEEIQWQTHGNPMVQNQSNQSNLLVDLVAPGGLRTLRNHMAMAQISWHPKKSLDCVRIFNTIDITRVVPVLTSTFSPVLRFKLTGGPHPNSWSTLLARHQGPSGRRHRTARGQHVMKHDET